MFRMEEAQSTSLLLIAWGRGEPEALEQLTPRVYGELHRLARAYLRRGQSNQTLQPTALISEAFVRLLDQSHPVQWENRAHFFGIAARLMRLILVDHARVRQASKRGGSAKAVTLDDCMAVSPGRSPNVLEVDEALERLAAVDERKAKVIEIKTAGKQIKVVSEFNGQKMEELYDRVLVSVGRTPNGRDLGLENTQVKRDEKGFIQTDEHLATADPNIYAIGDVAGGIMLAHKASKEARIAVENICGEGQAVNRDYVIPAVVFTDPEVAWVGLTEAEAKQKGIAYEVAKFPWGASGRALTYDRTDGLTKLLVDPVTERILGVGIVGHGAGELIGEGALALEMGATVHDLAAVVHPHPTLSETLMEGAEAFFGYATHVLSKKRPH